MDRNRYAEIMAQYQQAQPFSFTGYPSTYTGGYDVSQPQAYAAPSNRYADIMAQPAMSGGGRGMPADEGVTFTEPTSEQAYNVSQLGKNLRYISPLTGALASMYGNYLASQVNPNYSNEGRNYSAPTGGFLSTAPVQGDTSNYSNEGRNAPAPSAPNDGGNYSNEGRNYGGGGGNGNGGGVATGGNNGDASGGGDRGTRGGFAQGGHVSMMHLQGPNPMGPDDGYAALKDGEYVINDKAVKKYGIELMNAINTGKISKGKLRGLLEM
jgi:hypothetical protein